MLNKKGKGQWKKIMVGVWQLLEGSDIIIFSHIGEHQNFLVNSMKYQFNTWLSDFTDEINITSIYMYFEIDLPKHYWDVNMYIVRTW